MNAALFAKKYAEQGIRKGDNGLYCIYCNNKKISSKAERDVKQHIFGKRTKEEKQTKHQKNYEEANKDLAFLGYSDFLN